MPNSYYSQEFETICLYCYLAPDKCIEVDKTLSNQRKVICPILASKRYKLTSWQAKQISEIARIRQYQPKHFLKMVEIQAERNALPIETVTNEPTKIAGVS